MSHFQAHASASHVWARTPIVMVVLPLIFTLCKVSIGEGKRGKLPSGKSVSGETAMLDILEFFV